MTRTSLSQMSTCEGCNDDERYWATRLAGELPVLELPTDRTRPPVKGATEGRAELLVSPSVVAALDALATRTGTELRSVVLSTFLVFLSRMSGHEELVTLLLAGDGETEPLPLRTAVPGEAALEDLTTAVSRDVAEAIQHRRVSLAALAQRMNAAADVSRAPFTSVGFSFGEPTSGEPPAEVQNWLELLLRVTREGPALRCEFRYDATLFDDETMHRWMGVFELLLDGAATHPSSKVGALAVLTEGERRLLSSWNQTSVELDVERCVHELFEAQVVRDPGAVAVVVDGDDAAGETITYGALDRRAEAIAQSLREAGVGRGTLVGLLIDRSVDLIAGLLGVLKAGAGYVPLDPAHPVERLRFVAADTNIPVLLSSRGIAFSAELGVPRIVDVEDAAEQGAAEATSRPRDERSATPADTAYVIFTSGSTGKPKGVVVPHRSVVNLVLSMRECPGMTARDVALAVATLTFDLAVTEVILPLTVGAKIVLVKRHAVTDGARLLQIVREREVSFVVATPSTWRLLLGAGWEGGGGVTAVCGGEAMPPDLAEALLPRAGSVWNAYGPTETTVWSTFWRVELGRMLIGRPIANTQIHILDPRMNLVPVGVVGEIYIGGEGVTNGYLNRPELTERRFVPDPFREGRDAKLYRTGDLGRYLPDGRLECLGRNDNQVKLRGYRIELGEIEDTLTNHPRLRQAAVIVREDHPGDRRLVGYYVDERGGSVSEADIRAHLKRTLPEYMVPQRFVRLEEMPLTPNGKIDRKALPRPLGRRPDMGTDFVEPSTQTERTLAGVFAFVLGIDQVGARDGFFDLGGSSLLAMRAVSLLEKEHGLNVPVLKLFQHPRLGDLARWLDEQRGTASGGASRRRGRRQATSEPRAPVAIVGMSGRFPGARDVEELWRNVSAGKDSVSRFSDAELDPEVAAAARRDPRYVKARGIIEGADTFDAAFFGITPAEATLMDPQQRVFLEASWSALEHAGYTPEGYDGRIGVFGGVYQNSYYATKVLARPDLVEQLGAFQVMFLNDKDYVATRTAYKLDLTGPAIGVHTACSTSLVAVCEAVRSLRAGDCDMAIAGGVSITVPVRSGHVYQEGAMLSRDGRCQPFDASATGTLFSDGAALVVLKRLDDALADGDTIYAVVRGVGINNDGGRKASFTAPSADGQAAAITSALEDGGVAARSISYVEAHGTATPLGDPIEVEALTKAFRATTNDRGFCALGSIKSNVGHLVTAAGTAGLIKAAFSLFHRKLAPSLHFTRPNPNIDFANSPFFVQTEFAGWTGERPLRAGVSSFGVGGTNAHVIVEEPPERPDRASSRPAHLLLVSARSTSALDVAKRELSRHLRDNLELDVADVAYTLQVGRRGFRERSIVVAKDREEAISKLSSPGVATRSVPSLPARLAFMFPGQGAQYVGMGSGLYRSEPSFRAVVDLCARILEPLLGRDLREVMFASGGDTRAAELLRATQFTQPALFVIEYALAQLWRMWGVIPEAMIGHSVGEFVCATLAGVMSVEDALRLVAERGRLMQSLPPGGMLSVRLAAERVRPRLRHPELAIASVNGPSLCVVSGPSGPLRELERELANEGVVCRPLQTSHAFHSPMMDPVVEPFAEFVSKVALSKPTTPFVSAVTGRLIEPGEATSPMYWARHLRESVHFAEGIRTLWETPGRLLLEVGPRTTLATLARQQVTDRALQIAVSSLGDTAEGDAEYAALLNAAGHLWLSGISPAWSELHGEERGRRVPLPTYPFERRRFWIEGAPPASEVVMAPSYREGDTAVTRATEPTPEASRTPPSAPSPARLGAITATVKQLIEESSGVEVGASEDNTSFVELGLDSLFLTQIALTIEKRFGVETTLWHLLEEHPTLGALARHIEASLPSEPEGAAATVQPALPGQGDVAPAVVLKPVSAVAPAVPASAPAVTFEPGTVQYFLEQQLRLISQQLALLGGAPLATNAAAPSIAASQLEIGAPADARADQPAVTLLGTPLANDVGATREVYDAKRAFGAAARITLTTNQEPTPNQRARLEALVRRYCAKTKGSKRFTEENRGFMADPRVVTGFRPNIKEMVYPIVVERSLGSRLWDVDGNEYVDVLCGFGSNFFGWSPPFILDAVREQLERGIELGPQHPLTGEVARLLCEITGFERAAFCNTGSEAVMGALRIARTVTGRRMVASFNNSYHGVNDEVIVRGTKKGRAIPAAPGIMPSTAENIMVLDYGTPETLETLRANAGVLAAVLVEPVQSRRPEFQPREFLREVRRITAASGCALIFDEVVTGFRIAPGGAQEHFGVRADLATYGKVIGGGMPIGVIAGLRRFMDALDGGAWRFGDDSKPTAGVTYFAGTFVRHPLALAAARASLLHLRARGPELQRACNARTERLASELNAFFTEVEAPLEIRHFGSVWKTCYLENQPFGDLLFIYLRDRGLHILDGFASFLGEAHTDADVDFIVRVFRESVLEMQEAGFLPAPARRAAAVM
ncbi:amino acid adenylation domain-containing protein [Myxococcus sp. AM009]|nr:amino acid adenylation domain-containing protein [Myxococcus sp. AM009]